MTSIKNAPDSTGVKSQLFSADFGKLIVGAQPCQREQGVFARDEQQMKLLEAAGNQLFQNAQNGRVLNNVKIIQDEDQFPRRFRGDR